MKKDLQVAFIQANLHWEDAAANLDVFSKMLEEVPAHTDLILLPEMFSTGFSMKPETFAETMHGEVIAWMKQNSSARNTVICGSLMMSASEKYHNRLIWMRPDGSFDFYDKRHLFGLGEENRHYTAGKDRLIVTCEGWKVLPLICYDLRFPVWARNTEGYDLLLYVANWPERRMHAWKTLLEARAIENQCYVIGVNRVGNDGSGIYHSGESSLIDPKGDVLIREEHTKCVKTFTLSQDHLNHIRESLPFLKDRDDFILK